MSPLRRREPETVSARPSAPGIGRRWLHSVGSAVLGVVLVATLLAGLVALRLSFGPLELPLLARIAEREIAARTEGVRVGIGAVVLRLGRGKDDPAGLRLRDVTVTDAEGRPVFAAPEIRARFRMADAVRGRIEPVELFVNGASGRIIRKADGSFEIVLPSALSGEMAEAGSDAFSSFIEALARNRIPVLNRLQRITLRDARLTYSDRITGQVWQTDAAHVSLARKSEGIAGYLRVSLPMPEGNRTALSMVVRYRPGDPALALKATFSGVRPADLAGQLPALSFLAPLEAALRGELGLSLGIDGTLREMTARLNAGAGRFRLDEGHDVPIQSARLALAFDPRTDWLSIDEMKLATGFGQLDARGTALLQRDGAAFEAMEAELDIAELAFDGHGALQKPVRFTDGVLRFGAEFAPLQATLHELSLSRGPSKFRLTGGYVPGAAGISFLVHDLDSRGLVALWPVAAAPGAREWVETSLPEGVVSRLEGAFSYRDDQPGLTMQFAFHDAVAHPVPGLPPIREAAGSGTLDLKRFRIALDRGWTRPEGQARIDMAGSVFAIPDLEEPVQKAEVSLEGAGRLEAVLALIDTEPLSLLQKIGARPDLAAGQARVEARLVFPLLKTLKPGQVDADVKAELGEVALAGLPSPLPLTDGELTLRATSDRVEATGRMRVGAELADITWQQLFRGRGDHPQSRVTGRFGLTPSMLADLGARNLARTLSGSVPAALTLELDPESPPKFELIADLTPAAVAVPELSWVKPAGETATLAIRGTREEGLKIRQIVLGSKELQAEGSMEIGPDGKLRAAHFDRVRMADAVDAALTVSPDIDGTPRIAATGGTLDLVAFGRMVEKAVARDADPGMRSDLAANRITLSLDRLKLTEHLALTPAEGWIDPAAPGGVLVKVTGPANGGVPAEITVTRAGGNLVLRLETRDAGRLLQDADYFTGGIGGRMVLAVGFEPGTEAMTGRLVITGIRVRNAPVLGRMLSVASVTGVLEQLTTGGLGFSRVAARFSRRDGVFHLENARATGGSIGLTLNGTYDETGDRLDLSGVFSPAYLLNGILGEVPLVGTILTGRRGEGIFGFSYTVRGSAKNPAVTVNPLSIFAPGLLRGVVSPLRPSDSVPAKQLPGPDAPSAAREHEAMRQNADR
ncbi:MAG: hypothetical protein D6754_06000 [Alphaproteobacteria bacterium]|nr:MAG: hypothetical protein D6754_06000 [Alphaproteobacteria bacterium]